MIKVEDSVIARLKKENLNFEILVDCEKAMDFRKGNASIDDVLVTDDIFKDSKKGEHASEHDLMNVFKTENKKEIAERILKKGEVQLTTEFKNKLREEKKKKIAFSISQYAINPQSNLPHPLERIESAMDEKRVKIDEFKSAESQVESIVAELREILPISYETKRLNLVVPAEASGKSFGIIKKYAKILRENWLGDGSLSVDVEVPAGLQAGLFDDLNNIAHGRLESKDLK
jgi:ribosome maturation protein SDO1